MCYLLANGSVAICWVRFICVWSSCDAPRFVTPSPRARAALTHTHAHMRACARANPNSGTHNCAHSEDAGVVCLPRVRIVVDGSTSPVTVGMSGVMELFVGGVWAQFSPADATTASLACSELGYGSGSVTPASLPSNNVNLPCTAVVTCNGETAVEDCGTSDNGCASGFNTVTCGASSVTPSPTPATNGTIRFVGGPAATPTYAAGRVEMFYTINGVGSWGTVCDDSWGPNDALVACMQYSAQNGLGWTPSTLSVHASSRALYGAGPASEPIWLDDVVCTGNEATLTACQHQPIGTHNCIHDEGAC